MTPRRHHRAEVGRSRAHSLCGPRVGRTRRLRAPACADVADSCAALQGRRTAGALLSLSSVQAPEDLRGRVMAALRAWRSAR